MKNAFALLLAACSATLLVGSVNADVLANWNFQTSTSTNSLFSQLGTHTSVSDIPSDYGSGMASGSHASSATTFSSPSGNGSTNSLSSNNWGVGDYYQFSVSTVGYQGIMFSWDQVGSGTGPGNFALQYSTDGSSFTQFATYTLPSAVTSWSPASSNSLSAFSYDLSSITSLNDASTIYLRLVDLNTTSVNGGTVGTSGSGRVDDITIYGTVSVPEPSTLALAVFGGIASFMAIRRRR